MTGPGSTRLAIVACLAAGGWMMPAQVVGVAQAQSFTSNRTSSATFLGVGGRHRTRSIRGRPVVFTFSPTIGINLNTHRSSAYYIAPLTPRVPGGDPAYFGYPPYYGPPYLSAGVGLSGYGVPPWDYSARPYYWPRYADAPPLFEVARRVDPALLDLPAPARSDTLTHPPAAGAPPPPPRDEAIQALRYGEYLLASDLLLARFGKQVAAEPTASPGAAVDRSVLRLMGVALAGARRYEQAAEVFERAYREDASLASKRFDGRRVVPPRSELRRIVTGAVAFAWRTNSAQAWRMVAYLMQAQGRERVAQRMLDRAAALAPPVPAAPEHLIPGGVLPEAPEPDEASGAESA